MKQIKMQMNRAVNSTKQQQYETTIYLLAYTHFAFYAKCTFKHIEEDRPGEQIDKQLHWSAYAIYDFILEWFRFVWFICNVKTKTKKYKHRHVDIVYERFETTADTHGIPIYVLY